MYTLSIVIIDERKESQSVNARPAPPRPADEIKLQGVQRGITITTRNR